MTKIITGDQQYIGIPNGAVLCIDKTLPHGAFEGALYHAYNKEAIPVGNMEAIVVELEVLFDKIQFPRASTTLRSFQSANKTEKADETIKRVVTDQELLEKFGELASFIIRVQQRQNSTWQGRITWREGNKTKSFNSKWEMTRLIDLIIRNDEDCSQTSDWNI